VPVWLHLARQPSLSAGARKKPQTVSQHRSGRRPRPLLLGCASTCFVALLCSPRGHTLLQAALLAAFIGACFQQLVALAGVWLQPQVRLVLEAKCNGQHTAVPALELLPVTHRDGRRSVHVGSAALQRLGLAKGGAEFEVAWCSGEVSPGALDSPCSLEPLGGQPVSVDGLIVPQGQLSELYDGSQISILAEGEHGRYGVSLIMGARFVTDKAFLGHSSGRLPRPTWPSSCSRRLGSSSGLGPTAIVTRAS